MQSDFSNCKYTFVLMLIFFFLPNTYFQHPTYNLTFVNKKNNNYNNNKPIQLLDLEYFVYIIIFFTTIVLYIYIYYIKPEAKHFPEMSYYKYIKH